MKTIVSLLFIFYSIAVSGQTIVVPEVGKPMPDFILNDIKNFRTAKASLQDFKGKWLFLDLWSYSCLACVESFPKINELQKRFANDAQFVLVGYNSYKQGKGIEKLYERVSKRLNLKITHAYDSVLVSRWDVTSVPHIYIIDPDGILRFITGGRDMTMEKIQQLIEGKDVTFFPKGIEKIWPEFGLTSVSNTDKVIYSSTLTQWNGEKQNSGYPIEGYINSPDMWKDGWRVAMAPLFELYNYAYLGRAFWFYYDTAFYGRIYAFPILEMKDSTFFQYDYKLDVGKHTYNYCLKLPDDKISMDNMMGEMQRGLKNTFGYDVFMETRQMPVWRLVALPGTEKNLHTTSTGKYYFSGGNAVIGFTVRNSSINNFLRLVTANLPNNDRLPYLDETGFSFNIDFTIDTDMTSFDSVRAVLRENGLDLLKGTKEMKVLVIKDPVN